MLELLAGDERTVPSKTHTATQLTCLMATYLAGDNRAEAVMADALRTFGAIERLLSRWQAPVEAAINYLDGASRLTIIARGYALGAAMAGALVFEEVSRLQAHAVSGGSSGIPAWKRFAPIFTPVC